MQQIHIPELAAGEIYLRGSIDKHGDVEHTVIVGINNDELPREQQREWAKSAGGVLFNRIDAIVVYNEHRGIVKPDWYWTDDDVEWDPASAWCQNFNYGYQYYNHKSAALRAVAVRRFK